MKRAGRNADHQIEEVSETERDSVAAHGPTESHPSRRKAK